jgi:hypothetical protein
MNFFQAKYHTKDLLVFIRSTPTTLRVSPNERQCLKRRFPACFDHDFHHSIVERAQSAMIKVDQKGSFTVGVFNQAQHNRAKVMTSKSVIKGFRADRPQDAIARPTGLVLSRYWAFN